MFIAVWENEQEIRVWGLGFREQAAIQKAQSLNPKPYTRHCKYTR